MNDPEIWKRRFEQYRPLELVKYAHDNVQDEYGAVKLALEELDRQLIAAGFKPRH